VADPDDLDEFDDIARVAARVARKYKRTYWWSEEEDLRQEAWAALLKAVHHWDPRVGAPLEAYLWRAANYALRPFVWKNASIASASYRQLAELFKHHRAQLNESIVDPAPSADEVIEEARWRRAIRKELARIFASDKDGSLAEAVLMAGYKPLQVAHVLDVPVQRVYSASAQIRRRIESDYTLFKLWRNNT